MSDEEVGKGIGEIPGRTVLSWRNATRNYRRASWPHLKRFNAGTVGSAWWTG